MGGKRMKIRDYHDLMDKLNPPPDLEERIRARVNAPRLRPRRTAGRILVVAAALCGTFLMAMAVSPQLRTAVLTFLQLEEAEQVPPPTGGAPDAPELIQATVAQEVEAQYIRLPGVGSGYSYGDGTLFQVERAEDASVLGVRYWAVEGDQLLPLETHTTTFSTAWNGVSYTDTVYWCTYDGALSCYCSGSAGMAVDVDCIARSIPGRTDAVLLLLSQGSQMSYSAYPVLLDLETGAVTELLAGTGWEAAAPLREVMWSSDLSAALFTNDRTGFFYCDRTAGTTVSLDARTGLEVFSALFLPDDTLLLQTRSGPEQSLCSFWTYDPENDILTQTFSDLPVYRERDGRCSGIQFCGCALGIGLSEDGTVSALNLSTGTVSTVEGFSWDGNEGVLLPNPDSSKVLFARYDQEASGLGVSVLGVMDLNENRFTLLEREGYEALYDSSLGWFDQNRVALWSRDEEDLDTYYLYLYQFE